MSDEFSWTAERVALLHRHFEEGLSAGQSARLLGKTRNAVVSKRHKLSLIRQRPSLRGAEPADDATCGPSLPRSRKFSDAPPAEIAPTLAEMTRGGPCLAKLPPAGCRWPLQRTLEEADAFTPFCAELVQPGYPYCARHCAMAYINPPPPAASAAVAAPEQRRAA